MTSIEELRQQARAGDLHALQALRDRGFFQSRPSPDGYPVSHAQRQIWTVDQMAGATGAFNIPIALELTGALDVAALRNALGTVIRRHESLRARFVPVGGAVRQFMSDEIPLPWTEQDLSGDTDALALARRIAAADAVRRFQLADGPPLRATLLRTAPDRHVLLFNIHHIVADLITIGIVLNELSVCYAAEIAGRTAALEPLAIQYRDFAARQQSWLAGEDAARALDYWHRRLAAPLWPLDVPADFVRSPLRNHAGAIERVALGSGLTQALHRARLRHGMTLFMVLMATVKLLLHRYTGQEDIIIGYPTSGRDSPDLAGQVGCFVNMVALRNHLGAEDSFDALLTRLRDSVLEAMEHQAYPFDLLVEELGMARDLSRSPVFDVSASLVNAETGELRFGDVAVTPIDNGYVGAKLDLAFDFHEAEDGLELAIGYSTDLFGAERIKRMAAHYRHLVTHATEHPDQPIGRLPMMGAEERHLVLNAFNTPDSPPPEDAPEEDATIVALFERHGAQVPDAPAIRFGDQCLGYGTLNRQANRLAHLLMANGIGPDCIVGVHLDTSIETVVGFLAILKAGGVYLPVDPSNPPERLTAMLEDALPVAILTRPDLADRLSIPLECQLLFWDDELRAELARCSDEDPPCIAGAADAAYAIYTSGSTGQPKAAVLLHRGLANVVREQVRQFRPRPGDRVLQFSALGFDASIFEMVLALGSGATLCLAEREHLLGGALVRTLERAEITMAVLPPSTLAALPDAKLPMLRVLMAAGEACSAEVVRRWAPGRAFHNLYGPTEATIWASGTHCTADAGAPTIGRPIGNTRLYILDSFLQPVPIGIPGELCIAGIGLARHYLNRPELTGERFIAAPIDGVPGGRLYRTGDMARWRADGTVEFLGRADVQVKLRGYRIEPGEVEAALEAHPAIRDAVVVARDGAVGQLLVAYVTLAEAAQVGEAELRQHLRGTLPEYMVPARVILLDAMPLTPNRKVDRRALPDPDATHRDRPRHYVAPRDDLEHALADLFADALRLERVGATDSLFDIGADSLNATRIVAQLHDAFRIEVSIPQLFQAATVRVLGDFLRTELPAGHADRIAAALRRLRMMSPDEKATLLARRRD